MRTALVLLVVLLGGTAGVLFYHGAFLKIQVSEETHGPYLFVFQPQVSVTHQSVGRTTEEIDGMLAGIGVENRQPMAVYFSDGSAEIGLAVEDVSLSLALSNGTTTRTIPEAEYMMATFPWKSPLSFVVGHYKVDPELEKYRARKGYEQSEDMTLYQGDHVLYLQRIRSDP